MILQQTKGLTSPFVSSSVETECDVSTSRAEINLAGTHSLNGQMHAKPVKPSRRRRRAQRVRQPEKQPNLIRRKEGVLEGAASSPFGSQVGLNCFYTNTKFLNLDKLRELIVRTYDRPKIDLIFISETWFSDTSPCILPNYKLFRKDRVAHAGGVAIYARDGLLVSEVAFPELVSSQAEHLWLQVHVDKTVPLLIGCVYRPPSSSSIANNEIITALQFANIFSMRKRYVAFYLQVTLICRIFAGM